MKDFYYSKKLDQHFSTRLDVLIYAHDGRGLGHASRSIGIGMALRRLYPDLKILFVTGAAISQSLIEPSGLDWIKLPSYASKIENGVSTGVDGPANFYKSVLGRHRADMLAQMVQIFNPRCVLVDHSPLGKREELVKAVEQSKGLDVKWVLGLRAVLGDPKYFWTKETRSLFRQFYHAIFWYGDRQVLGPEQMHRIEEHFGETPIEMGYVSRLFETRFLLERSGPGITGTISLPWLSQKSGRFVTQLKKTLSKRDPAEQWHIFIHQKDYPVVKDQFSDLPYVSVEPVGDAYVRQILQSQTAIVYGGYNSLMDVAAAKIPAIVVMREMADKEQDEHIQKLMAHSPKAMVMIEESTVSESQLTKALDQLLGRDRPEIGFKIQGSERAARTLFSYLSTPAP